MIIWAQPILRHLHISQIGNRTRRIFKQFIQPSLYLLNPLRIGLHSLINEVQLPTNSKTKSRLNIPILTYDLAHLHFTNPRLILALFNNQHGNIILNALHDLREFLSLNRTLIDLIHGQLDALIQQQCILPQLVFSILYSHILTIDA